jgi:hypothetical protein
MRATGAFDGLGKIIEVPNLPTDPDNVSRDDLVFAEGTLHLVNADQDFQFSLDPRSCLASFTAHQVSSFDGGTGLFSGATGTGVGLVQGQGVAQRAPDGSCSSDLLPAHEKENVSGTGTLSFSWRTRRAHVIGDRRARPCHLAWRAATGRLTLARRARPVVVARANRAERLWGTMADPAALSSPRLREAIVAGAQRFECGVELGDWAVGR